MEACLERQQPLPMLECPRGLIDLRASMLVAGAHATVGPQRPFVERSVHGGGADELEVRNVPERRPQLVDGPWRDVEKRHATDAACQAEGRETTARPDLQNVCAGCERQVLAQDLVADRKVM